MLIVLAGISALCASAVALLCSGAPEATGLDWREHPSEVAAAGARKTPEGTIQPDVLEGGQLGSAG